MTPAPRAEWLITLLTGLVGLGGIVAILAAVWIGDRGAGLGALMSVAGLILAAIILVLMELRAAVHDLVQDARHATYLARERRYAEQLRRQRTLNSIAFQLGYAFAQGMSARQVWDEILERPYRDHSEAIGGYPT